MTVSIAPAAVRAMLLTREEIALIDLREEARFALAHPLFAAQLSAGRIEDEAWERIPRRSVTLVLYDDGEGLVEDAAARFGAIGYTDVRALEGGLAGWRDAGYELFQDVNSYSKAFGELVEHRRHTPSLSAPEVQALIREQADIRIVDARRFDEYATMSIPTGTSVPGAELVLRAPALAPDPATTIIVNCAGRTRSIIGTQSLINAGVANRVVALRNGTIGWTLAGQELALGQGREAPEPGGDEESTARARARAVAYRAGVRHVDAAAAAHLAHDAGRTLYRFDVRTAAEYAAGHLPGFLHAPGGQLVQETDMRATVRGARILLADPRGVRADMTASWLAQMGWEVYVLDTGDAGAIETGFPERVRPPLPDVATIDAAAAANFPRDRIVDLASSRAHRAGHIPGARFAMPVTLAAALAALPGGAPVLLTSPDGALAAYAAARLADPRLRVLAGGTAAWQAAGGAIETGLADPLSPVEDIYKRPYEGTDNAAAAMQAYLDWEYGLVAQLERDATHGFVVI